MLRNWRKQRKHWKRALGNAPIARGGQSQYHVVFMRDYIETALLSLSWNSLTEAEKFCTYLLFMLVLIALLIVGASMDSAPCTKLAVALLLASPIWLAIGIHNFGSLPVWGEKAQTWYIFNFKRVVFSDVDKFLVYLLNTGSIVSFCIMASRPGEDGFDIFVMSIACGLSFICTFLIWDDIASVCADLHSRWDRLSDAMKLAIYTFAIYMVFFDKPEFIPGSQLVQVCGLVLAGLFGLWIIVGSNLLCRLELNDVLERAKLEMSCGWAPSLRSLVTTSSQNGNLGPTNGKMGHTPSMDREHDLDPLPIPHTKPNGSTASHKELGVSEFAQHEPHPKKVPQPRFLKPDASPFLPLKPDASPFLPYDYYVAVDFECTCQAERDPGWMFEIIEFAAVCVNAATHEIEFEFHSFVRPTESIALTSFCTALTGIDQSTVDTAPPLENVLEAFSFFLAKHNLVSAPELREVNDCKLFTIVTDGPSDMEEFLMKEAFRKGLPFHDMWHHWVDLKISFITHYKDRWPAMKSVTILGMLETLNLTFQGRLHSGLSDARAIARIIAQMLMDGHCLVANSGITMPTPML